MPTLSPAPATPWTTSGAPCFGTYSGECDEAPFHHWYKRVDRARAQKRWQWCGVLADDVALGVAIVRTGYAANVFCWVFDRARGEFRQDISRVLPRVAVEVSDVPGRHQTVARYRGLVEGVEMRRGAAAWQVSGSVGDVRFDLEIEEQAAPMTAICPVAGSADRVNVTRKQVLATARGTVRAQTSRYTLEGAPALLDHSHGMLNRETVWQWAIGAGRFEDDGSAVGFNLVAQFNDSLENAIWTDGEPSFAGPAEFMIPQGRTAPWRVVGERFDLELSPEGLRAQELDLGLVVSDYLQPLGEWRGQIDGRAVRATGVAELHRSVW